jgi:hypothetical protein
MLKSVVLMGHQGHFTRPVWLAKRICDLAIRPSPSAQVNQAGREAEERHDVDTGADCGKAHKPKEGRYVKGNKIPQDQEEAVQQQPKKHRLTG